MSVFDAEDGGGDFRAACGRHGLAGGKESFAVSAGGRGKSRRATDKRLRLVPCHILRDFGPGLRGRVEGAVAVWGAAQRWAEEEDAGERPHRERRSRFYTGGGWLTNVADHRRPKQQTAGPQRGEDRLLDLDVSPADEFSPRLLL